MGQFPAAEADSEGVRSWELPADSPDAGQRASPALKGDLRNEVELQFILNDEILLPPDLKHGISTENKRRERLSQRGKSSTFPEQERERLAWRSSTGDGVP